MIEGIALNAKKYVINSEKELREVLKGNAVELLKKLLPQSNRVSAANKPLCVGCTHSCTRI